MVDELAAYAAFAFRWHVTDPRRSRAGLLDGLLARYPDDRRRWNPRLILVECKKDDGWRWSSVQQEEVFRGLLAAAWWPRTPPPVEPRTRVAPWRYNLRSEWAWPRPEVYLWQPHHLEIIKEILCDGFADCPLR